ncbi:MAG TPA: hypothetical protein VEG08_13080 [Terriglobales bacterium]|nr:hypothetical protein [Terriglobales bacterium]
MATPTAPVERNARPEAFPHNPCYPHGVQQGGSCVPCPGGQLATVVNQCVAPPERNEAFDCELHPSNWGCGQSTSQGASLSCAWLLRQVEEEESELAQLNQQRSAACGQDASGADCQALSAQYQQLVQQVRQDQAAYNRCQISHR